jgi:membrane protease YdiL (CAAX protease family)
MKSNNQKDLPIGIYALLSVTIIMGFSGWLLKEFFNAPYGSYDMVRLTLPAEIIVVILLNFIVWKYLGYKRVGFNKPNLKGLFWFAPMVIILILNTILLVRGVTNEIAPQTKAQLLNIFLVTLLVGINEELLFRGILLESLITRFSKAKSIILSAIAFALFHAVNYFSGEPLLSILSQMIMAFIAGFFLGVIRIKMNSIWPLMLWHALWDCSIFCGATLQFPNNPILSVVPVLQIVVGILVFRLINKND